MRRAFPHGFSLVEVLAALVIFGVAIVGFMRAMGESTRIQADLLNMQRALVLAQNVMEEMRYSGVFEIGEEEGEFEGEDAMYHWRTVVEENPDFEGLLDLSVVIYWNDGKDQNLVLATQLAETEMQAE